MKKYIFLFFFNLYIVFDHFWNKKMRNLSFFLNYFWKKNKIKIGKKSKKWKKWFYKVFLEPFWPILEPKVRLFGTLKSPKIDKNVKNGQKWPKSWKKWIFGQLYFDKMKMKFFWIFEIFGDFCGFLGFFGTQKGHIYI